MCGAAGLYTLQTTGAAAKFGLGGGHVLNEEQYQKYLDYNSPVDSIDSRHQWLLSTEQQYRVRATVGKNLQTVMILSNNPLTDKTALVLGSASITDGAVVDLPVCFALAQETLYAALVDKDGKYYVTQFPANQMEVSFDNYSSGIPTDLTLTPQGYTYIFDSQAMVHVGADAIDATPAVKKELGIK